MAAQFATVDDYIASFPQDVQEVLRRIRSTIHNVVPDAGEKIAYNIPTITVDGRYLVYFAGWKNHVSVYPVPIGDEALEQEVAPYQDAKGTLKFPLQKPIPYDLIERVAIRLLEQRRDDSS